MRRRSVRASPPAANSTTSTPAMPIAARNGTRPRPRAPATASTAEQHSPATRDPAPGRAGRDEQQHRGGQQQHQGGGPRGAGSPPGGHPLRQPAHARSARRPPGRAARSRSARRARAAPPRRVTGQRGSGCPGSVHAAYAGSSPNPSTYMSAGPGRGLQPEVVRPGGRGHRRVDRQGDRADGGRQRERGQHRERCREPQGARADRPPAARLVGPARGRVPRRVAGVVGPADRELAREHGQRDEHHARRRMPRGAASAASSVAMAVMARLGTG